VRVRVCVYVCIRVFMCERDIEGSEGEGSVCVCMRVRVYVCMCVCV